MKIDSMDASNLSYSTLQNTDATTKVTQTAKPVIKEKTDAADLKNLSQLTEFDKRDLPISDKVVIDAIEKANRAISGVNRRFEFSIHEKTKEIMVKVIDSDTNEIIREIPPEKILDMVAKMWEMAGIIVDERR